MPGWLGPESDMKGSAAAEGFAGADELERLMDEKGSAIALPAACFCGECWLIAKGSPMQAGTANVSAYPALC